ncbi:Ribonuclease III [Mycena sanguinolenta]|uniref:Ribonuclease III n=1 Tax=Mycena sanguinolenta TaxID=230812 RepID=A0A8H7CXV5_9AGAR|nr:Ribonuclease III [Mycena sanguinolenta]
MSDSRLYSRLLLAKGHGYPLFHPQPYDDLPLEARKGGTEIGDVGIITSDGSFDPIFNICRAAGDPLNRFGVPDGFEQVRLEPGDIAPKISFHRPGSDVSSAIIRKRRLDIEAEVEGNVFCPLGVGAVVEVSTSSKAVAMLLLPDGASRTNLRRLQIFRDYALRHAERWYAFVNGDLQRMVESGDLYLVTGVDKTSSWSVAALENNSEDCELSLTLKPACVGSASATYAWDWECASSFTNSGPRRRAGEESWTDNQTVFLRGFKVAVRQKLLRKSSTVTVLSIEDSKPSDIFARGRSIPFARGRSHGSGGFSRSNTGSSTASGEQEWISDSKPYHPADAINTHLLQAFPDAKAAITHDDEWASVIDEREGIPTDTELVKRICELYKIENTPDGGLFLQHIDPTSPEGSPDPRNELRNPSKIVRASETLPGPPSNIFPEISREDLRMRVFNPKPSVSTGSTHQFEDPASKTPDIENLEDLGDSVLRLVVTSLIAELYPGLRVGPAAKLRELLLDNTTLDHLCEKSNFLNRLKTSSSAHGIHLRVIFKAFIGALHLDQGLGPMKPQLDALFRPYCPSAYELVRESYRIDPSKQLHTASVSPSQPIHPSQSPPSPSSADSSVNHLALFNESVQQGNWRVEWVYSDHPSAATGLDAGGSNRIVTSQESPPRGSKANSMPVWSVEVRIDGECFGRGEGNTKKAARNQAAKEALSRLGAVV